MMSDSKTVSTRRVVGVIVTGEAVASIVREGKRILDVPSAVPTTAKFVKAWFDHVRNAFVVVFEDDSFDPVYDGLEIPLLQMPPVVITTVDEN